MSHSSTFSSKLTWRRIAIDVLCVIGVLLVLEMIVRLPPVHDYLAARLDTYEHLFWHDPNMPRYTNDLRENPDYTFWFVGSSYMMTAINPAAIRPEIAPMTAQNFGMTVMTNLAYMSEIMTRWMLQQGEPQTMVLFVAEPNFSNPYLQESRNGIFEQTFLFPDSISDNAGRWLYNQSQLYRYLLLARNAPLVPYEDTLREPRENGGFWQHIGEPYTCPTATPLSQQINPITYHVGHNNLETFITMTQQHNIPLMIISIPIPECTWRLRYMDFADYQNTYLQPVAALAEEHGIPFFELDTRFQAEVASNEQQNYFYDAHHANQEGAELFSVWTTGILNQWLADNRR